MTRRRKRSLALVYFFAVAALLVWLGGEGWAVNGLQADYLGYLIGSLGVAAVFGLNIWYGGPLDPRDDPPMPAITDGLVAGQVEDSESPTSADCGA